LTFDLPDAYAADPCHAVTALGGTVTNSTLDRRPSSPVFALVSEARTITRYLLVALASLIALLGICAASAVADPTYGTINAEGGIYWRSGPDWNTAEAIGGFGFYPDTVLEVHCYQAGAGDVPGSADYMWEQATDVGGSGYGSGWVNEHFINDGQPINQPSPGVPQCGASSTPPAPSTAPASTSPTAPATPGAEPAGPARTRSVFYSGTENPTGVPGINPAQLNLAYGTWRGGSSCTPANAVSHTPTGVEILAGWSKGRLGPIYFLEGARSRWSEIHWILLFDPGQSGEMKGNCDEQVKPSINSLLANWLKSNPANHLIVLTGWVSEEKSGSKSVFGGLWHYYFAGIWNQPFANQALVCDYNNLSHEEVIRRFAWDIQNPLTGCPNASGAPSPTAWHP
jgi:hypothetical protein